MENINPISLSNEELKKAKKREANRKAVKKWRESHKEQDKANNLKSYYKKKYIEAVKIGDFGGMLDAVLSL